MSITMDDIANNPNIKWNYESVSYNPNLTLDFVKDNPDKCWNWGEISDNPFK
jgi:hypothetical protein